MDFGFSSPKSTKSFMHDQSTDKKLKHGLVSLSWQQSKNFIDIPKMIERIPGENFIGEYLTHACYELPVSFLTKEQLKKIPHFNRMSGRYRRLPGSLVRNMTGQQRAEPRDGASPDLDRPKNINYEKLLQGYEKLGHMKKLAVPFDMSKSKARDMNMLMQQISTKTYYTITTRCSVKRCFLSHPDTTSLVAVAERLTLLLVPRET